MKAVVLAAGRGERLPLLTDYKPNFMLPIIDHFYGHYILMTSFGNRYFK